MLGSRHNLLHLLETLGLPQSFLVALLLVLLALTLAPFLGGRKVGPVEIPELPKRGRYGLLAGMLCAWLALLIPVFPAEQSDAAGSPCLLEAKVLLTEMEPQTATLDAFLRHFQQVMADHELPVGIHYDETLLAAGLPQQVLTLHRTGSVAKDGCRLLAEIAEGLHRTLVLEGNPLRITILASCDDVLVAPRGADPPSEEHVPCS